MHHRGLAGAFEGQRHGAQLRIAVLVHIACQPAGKSGRLGGVINQCLLCKRWVDIGNLWQDWVHKAGRYAVKLGLWNGVGPPSTSRIWRYSSSTASI